MSEKTDKAGSSRLPTVELMEDHYYWIRRRYEDTETWTVALWQVGIFWDLNGKEVSPRTICGPIPKPSPCEAPQVEREGSREEQP